MVGTICASDVATAHSGRYRCEEIEYREAIGIDNAAAYERHESHRSHWAGGVELSRNAELPA